MSWSPNLPLSPNFRLPPNASARLRRAGRLRNPLLFESVGLIGARRRLESPALRGVRRVRQPAFVSRSQRREGLVEYS